MLTIATLNPEATMRPQTVSYQHQDAQIQPIATARDLPTSSAELNQPPTRLGKFKLWIWNSSKTWSYLPLKILGSIDLIFGSAALGVILVALLLSGGIIGAGIGVIVGGICKLCGIGFIAPFFITLAACLVASAFVFMLPSIAYGIVYAAIYYSIKAIFSFIGALFGLLTSVGLLFKDPHTRWQRQEANERIAQLNLQAELQSAQTELRDQLRPMYSIARNPVATTIAAVTDAKIPEIYRKFADFNPNISIITDTMEGGIKPLDDIEQEVIKASDGNYYLQKEFNQAKRDGRLVDITYTNNDKVPEELKIKFTSETECPIALGVISQADAVRTIYGKYYDKDFLSAWINGNADCPPQPTDPYALDRRQPLTMKYTCGITETIHLAPPPPSVFTTAGQYFSS